MKRARISILFLILLLISFLPYQAAASAQTPLVRAVLFYSPTCGHCAQVINEVLPELDQKYGSQLLIYGINTFTEEGNLLFTSYVEAFDVPPEDQVVPTLVVGDTVLIGSADIPNQFPGIIDTGLAEGGIDWPIIPGLIEAISGQSPDPSEPASTPEFANALTVADKFQSDLAANILAVIVLIGMIAVVISAFINLRNESGSGKKPYPDWLIPVLAIAGIGIAAYLTYVEVNQVEAVCGPVGNCNTVQQSKYATLFGILPIGILGIVGYLAIIILWLVRKLNLENWNHTLDLLLFGATFFGTLFSIYLTFLEPFVIGATCMWCLSSAVIITLLFRIASRRLIEPESETD